LGYEKCRDSLFYPLIKKNCILVYHPFKFITIASGFFGFNFFLFIIIATIARGLRFYLVAFLLKIFGGVIDNIIDRYFNILTLLFFILLIGSILILKLL
jgi:hypothetical protein